MAYDLRKATGRRSLPLFLSRSSSSIGITSTGMSMAPVFQSTEAGSGSEAIASKAVAVAALAPTCAEHQTRKRNDPRHREMDTSPSKEVKTRRDAASAPAIRSSNIDACFFAFCCSSRFRCSSAMRSCRSRSSRSFCSRFLRSLSAASLAPRLIASSRSRWRSAAEGRLQPPRARASACLRSRCRCNSRCLSRSLRARSTAAALSRARCSSARRASALLISSYRSDAVGPR